MVVCREIAKTSLIDLSLACSIEKLYCFADFGVVREVFRGILVQNALQYPLMIKLMHY